jgi:hypothetical protein
MPDDPTIRFRHQRHRKGVGGTQRPDDEMLRVAADLQGLESRHSDLGYRTDIVRGLAPDNDVWIHGLKVLLAVGECRG